MSIQQFWRLQPQFYRLIGEVCKCGVKIFPPRDVCPECGNLEPITVYRRVDREEGRVTEVEISRGGPERG